MIRDKRAGAEDGEPEKRSRASSRCDQEEPKEFKELPVLILVACEARTSTCV